MTVPVNSHGLNQCLRRRRGAISGDLRRRDQAEAPRWVKPKRVAWASRFLSTVHITAAGVSRTEASNAISTAPQPGFASFSPSIRCRISLVVATVDAW